MKKEDIRFTDLRRESLPIVCEIYNYYIKNSTFTFHSTLVNVNDLARFIPMNEIKYKSFLINLKNEGAIGYCYLSQYKKREAYDGTVEISIYIKHDFTKMGIAAIAYEHLEQIAKELKIHTILAFISGDNPASVKFFTKMGFNQCGHFCEVGIKFNKLLDVYVYQKLLS